MTPINNIKILSKFRIAIYGILVENGRVLMTETRIPSGALMNFPGGGLELGESPKAALEREFQEETGVSISVDKLIFCSEVCHQNPDYPQEQIFHVYYKVTRINGNVSTKGNNDDVLSLEWFSMRDLPRNRMSKADMELLDKDEFLRLMQTSS